MTRTVLLVAVLCVTQSSASETPTLFKQREFSAANMSEAVNHFIALGEKEASTALIKIASLPAPKDQGYSLFDPAERASWVCRILYEAKGKEPIRPPLFGGLSLPNLSMPASSWPLYPVVKSRRTYFVLDEGYALAGEPERFAAYMEYCKKHGRFRKAPVKVPTRAEALRDLEALRESKQWKEIKWTDAGPGGSYKFSEARVLDFLTAQAATISE